MSPFSTKDLVVAASMLALTGLCDHYSPENVSLAHFIGGLTYSVSANIISDVYKNIGGKKRKPLENADLTRATGDAIAATFRSDYFLKYFPEESNSTFARLAAASPSVWEKLSESDDSGWKALRETQAPSVFYLARLDASPLPLESWCHLVLAIRNKAGKNFQLPEPQLFDDVVPAGTNPLEAAARLLAHWFVLAFKEALKNDELAYKSYQIYIHAELQEHAISTKALTERLLANQ
ncbi:MAG: hypothetical protein SFY68_07205, partial [Candidatus Sumerlaeia bacterium]|nr:hypothetical protein [Candidatus Sumerlaeia bacterium]